MPNQEEGGAKKEETLSWRKCPVCAQEFQDFLPLITHLEEHRRRESQQIKIELGADDYLQKAIAREFFQGTETDKNILRPTGGAAKRKFAADAKGLLVAVADWLQEALMTFSDINSLLTS